MKLRWRLLLALALAGLLPLIPLLFVVHSSVSLSADTLAPEEIGDALGSAVELSRKLLDEKRALLQRRVENYAETLPLPQTAKFVEADLDSGEALYVNYKGDWYRHNVNEWIYGSPGATVEEESFRGFPVRINAEYRQSNITWLLDQAVDPAMIETAQKMQAVRADWTLRSFDRNRLILSLVLTYVTFYLAVVLISLAVAMFVVVPETRRIEELARVMERVGEGEEELRAREGGGGEVARLAATFNLMIYRLETSRKRASEMERMAAWRELARVLAHEIKNPLTPIQLSVQQITDEYQGGDERYIKLLETTREIVNEEIESLRKLVREFSDFARAPQLELTLASPVELAHDLSSFYGGRVRLIVTEEPQECLIDREKIKRALINLLDNALHAAGEEGEVCLCLGVAGETVVFTVEDNGPGVPPEKRDEVFEPYVTSKRTGVGLGLPVVRSVAREHGGDVTLDESETLGGARFTLTVPIRVDGSTGK